ncbi:LysE/ArgO family amino acid transporter [Stagnihabitans tardus]|uniref:LysE family transporter n=1 Tax=Stagnihabitans tardus TaxID=2699202 RepID=A0AAE5BUP9_9RHOB|nr:LysE/ArgO family amino acid transporter [Stagnihabitans tardus]NBZ88131.1 LysE family transporter [Stagnihabitans tardus]
MLTPLIQGFFTGLSLILAIGAQNAFVLRQGIRREHVLAVVAVCAISDALLIAAGVAGFGTVTQALPWLVPAMRWFGAAFLAWYGWQRLQAARKGGEALRPADAAPAPLRQVLGTCLLLTWANPHVYLDTMVLLGSISTQHTPHEATFGLGAAISSLTFFAALGFGARLLAPLFAKPRAWVILELIVGLTMWTIAASLLLG